MSTINLAVEKSADNNYPKFFKGGLVGASVVLLLLLCVYGGLLYMNKGIVAKIENVHAQYLDEYNKFLVGNANEVIDFRNRSVAAEKFISQSLDTKELFGQLEGSILPAIYLNSLTYNRDSNTFNLDCVANGFNAEAKQILSFKENDAVASLVVDKSTIDATTGLVNFSISLKMK